MKILKFIKLSVLVFLLCIGLSDQLLAQQDTWKAPTEADNLENPFKADQSVLKEGKKLYVQMCAMCHGDTGKGDGIAGTAFDPRPANFNTVMVQDQSDGAIFWKMTKGRTPMLAYEAFLSEKQRWVLVNYIRELSKNNK